MATAKKPMGAIKEPKKPRLRRCGCGEMPYLWPIESSSSIGYAVLCYCGMRTSSMPEKKSAVKCWNRGLK